MRSQKKAPVVADVVVPAEGDKATSKPAEAAEEGPTNAPDAPAAGWRCNQIEMGMGNRQLPLPVAFALQVDGPR